MTILNLPATLAIARYRYTFTLTRTMRAPAYPGSALRGAFGHALRRACVPRGHAPSALLLQNSPYTHIFEPAPRPDIGLANPATIPPPYIIEPETYGERCEYPAGSTYRFSLVLIGDARHHLPLISYAWQQAFKNRDGIAHGQGELTDIAIERADGWENIYADGRITPHDNHLTLPENHPHDLTLHILTPLRLQKTASLSAWTTSAPRPCSARPCAASASSAKSTSASPHRPITPRSKPTPPPSAHTPPCAGTTGSATPTASNKACTSAAPSATGTSATLPPNTPAPCTSANGCTSAKTPPSASAAIPSRSTHEKIEA